MQSEFEIAEAKKRLLIGGLSNEEKKELLAKVKGDKDFEEMFIKHEERKMRSLQKEEDMKMQNENIEELKMESLQVDEEIKKEKKIGKWKRRLLAFFCIRFEKDD